MEEDVGLSVGAAWIAGQDRSMWRTLLPSAGQAQQWVSEYPGHAIFTHNARNTNLLFGVSGIAETMKSGINLQAGSRT